MASITGNTQMGMQLVAGDARQCASGPAASIYGAWKSFADATRLTDVPVMHRTRRPRSSQ